jgi:hypothetical protein
MLTARCQRAFAPAQAARPVAARALVVRCSAQKQEQEQDVGRRWAATPREAPWLRALPL